MEAKYKDRGVARYFCTVFKLKVVYLHVTIVNFLNGKD